MVDKSFSWSFIFAFYNSKAFIHSSVVLELNDIIREEKRESRKKGKSRFVNEVYSVLKMKEF